MRVGEGEREERWEEGGLRGVDELEDVGRGRDSIVEDGCWSWLEGAAGGTSLQTGDLHPFHPLLCVNLSLLFAAHVQSPQSTPPSLMSMREERESRKVQVDLCAS